MAWRRLLTTVLVALLCGCAVGERHRDPAEVTASVQDAGDQAASAVATVRTAVELLRDDRLAVTVADTTQADSIRVLEQATRTLTTLAPPTPGTRHTRDDLLAVVQQATTAVVAAGAWIAGDRTGSPDQVLAMLAEAETAVSG